MMEQIYRFYKRPSKYRCLGFLTFVAIGLAILNVIHNYHIAMCDYISVCEVETPLLFLMIPILMMVYGLAMFIYQAYRDFIQKDYEIEAAWEE